jgi:hypothetical protein
MTNMHKVVLVLTALIVFSGCKKNLTSEAPINPGSQSIAGKWKLSDSYGSPGGPTDIHAIPWIPATTHISHLDFSSNGEFINSADPQIVSDHYEITDSTLVITRGGKEMYLGYKLSPPYLEIYGNMSFDYLCIEFCGTRYISEQ